LLKRNLNFFVTITVEFLKIFCYTPMNIFIGYIVVHNRALGVPPFITFLRTFAGYFNN